MPTALINNTPVELDAAEQLNCIQAAQRIGFEIPHYCWHPALSVVASCRMCLVEVGEKKPDGTVVMQPKLVPGCQTPVKDGTVIVADSPKVKAAQQATLEYLLLNHPLDCPTCDQAGECFLQDYSYKYGRGYSRLQEPKNLKPDKDHIGDQITLFTDRCIMCTRCVRFTREVSGTAELQVISRGTRRGDRHLPRRAVQQQARRQRGRPVPGRRPVQQGLPVQAARVVAQDAPRASAPTAAPAAASTSIRTRTASTASRRGPTRRRRATSCATRAGSAGSTSTREQRLTFPEQRDGRAASMSRGWDDILPALREALKKRAQQHPQEDRRRALAVDDRRGSVPAGAATSRSCRRRRSWRWDRCAVVGEDDKYPKDVHGNAVEPTKFTIRAEKAPEPPRRRADREKLHAVAAHVRRHAGRRRPAARSTRCTSSAAIPAGWITEEQAAALERVPLLIVQDMLQSPASRAARRSCCPGGSFAERDGTFVNHAGLAQEIRRVDPRPRRLAARRPHPVGPRRPHGLVPRRRAAAAKLRRRFPSSPRWPPATSATSACC